MQVMLMLAVDMFFFGSQQLAQFFAYLRQWNRPLDKFRTKMHILPNLGIKEQIPDAGLNWRPLSTTLYGVKSAWCLAYSFSSPSKSPQRQDFACRLLLTGLCRCYSFSSMLRMQLGAYSHCKVLNEFCLLVITPGRSYMRGRTCRTGKCYLYLWSVCVRQHVRYCHTLRI